MRRLLACVAIAVAALSAEALGQVSPSPQSLALLPETAWEPAPDTVAEPERATWLPPVSSLIIPGSGQLMMGQERGAIYLVLEALFLTQAISFSTEGGRESDRFRELAFTVARAPFDPVKPDTVFEYYEKVADFAESGPFDTDPGPALVPPTDVRTFNGAQWDLAQRTFFTDPDNPPPPESPEYLRALEFYRRRAVGPNFLWTWRNAGLEQDLYRQSIRSSDDAFRRATTWFGLLLANHVLSFVDAFITTRLAANKRQVGIDSAILDRGPGQAPAWQLSVRVGF